MSVSEQTRLLGESEGARVEIETTGDVFRRFLALPAALVDECRFQFIPDDGLGTSAVDPANCAMIDVWARQPAFDGFDANEVGEAGIDLECLTSRASNARMGRGTNDDLRVEFNSSTTELTVERGYGSTTVRQRDAWLNIDTAAVRAEPDVPDMGGLEAAYHKVEGIDPGAFGAAIEGVGRNTDHAEIRAEDGDLVFVGEKTDEEGDLTDATRVTIEEVVASEDADVASLFSVAYLDMLDDGLATARVDDLTLWVADNHPIFIEFERTDDEDRVLYDGRFCLAPRIRKEGDDL